MAIALPAALPIAVARRPTIKAITVEVMAPCTMYPFGSKETAYQRAEYCFGRISGNRQPAATDQIIIDRNGKKIQNTNRPRNTGRKRNFIIFYLFDESIAYRQILEVQ